MPTLDYLTGFNPRVVAAYTSSGSPTIETATVRRVGGTSLKFVPAANGVYVSAAPSSAPTVITLVCYFNIQAFSGGTGAFCGIGSGNGDFVGLGTDTANDLALYYITPGSGANVTIDAHTYATSTWYRGEISVSGLNTTTSWITNAAIYLGDSTTALATWTSFADGATHTALTGVNATVFFGSPRAQTGLTGFITDCAFSLSSADYPIGPASVYGFSPNAVGTHSLDTTPSAYFFKEVATVDTALTTSETTSYQTIDDIPIDVDVDSIWVGTTTGAPATPAFRSAGTVTFSANNVTNTSLTPGTPGTKSVGDLLVLVAACSSNANTVTTPSGWNVVSGFPKASGTATGGKMYVFTRIADGTATDVPAVTFGSMTTGTSGTPGAVVILVYQNGTETLDGSLPTLTDTTATTLTTIPAFTTGTNNSMVIGIAMKMQDLAQSSTVATFTERVDSSTTNAIGWVLEVSDKVQTTLGSSGTAAVTWSSATSGRTVAISLGFKSSLSVVQPTNTWYAEHGFDDANLVAGVNIGSTTGTTNFGQDSSHLYQAYAFTPTNSGAVSYVKVTLLKSGTITDNLTVSIYATSGSSPASSALGTSSAVTGSLVTGAGAPLIFPFSSGPNLTAGTQYWIAVTRSGAADAANFFQFCSDSVSAAVALRNSTDGVTWTGSSTVAGPQFIVGYGTQSSAPLGVRAIVAQALDTATSSTWAAKLFDSVQATNTEDISNSSISSVTKAYVGKTFAQRPNTGGVWTVAALNGTMLRFGYTAAATGHPRIEAAMLEAAFGPSTTRQPRHGFINHANPGIA